MKSRSGKDSKIIKPASGFSPAICLLVSICVNFLLFGIFFLVATPSYGGNDDTGMMFTAAGFTSGSPSEYLIFTNIVIGLALKGLYSLNNNFDWYSLYIYAVHFFAMSGLFYLFLRRRFSVINFVLYLILFVFFEIRFLLLAQWTTTAGVAAIAGILLLLGATENKLLFRCWQGFVGVFLIVLCTMIRVKMFYLIMLLSLPLILVRLWITRSRRLFIFLALTVFLSFCAIGIDRIYYMRDAEWSYYRDFNRLRWKIHDRPRSHQFIERDVVGWSENDAKMFSNWFFFDPEVYSLEKLAEIVKNEPLLTGSPAKAWKVFFNKLYRDKPLVFFTMANMLICIILLRSNRCHFLVFILGIVVITALICGYLVTIVKFSMHVFLPMLFLINAGSFFMILEQSTVSGGLSSFAKNHKFLFVIKAILFIVCIGIYSLPACEYYRRLRNRSTYSRASNDEYRWVIDRMVEDFPDERTVFILWGNLLKWHIPFRQPKKLTEWKMIGRGWKIHSPLYKDAFKYHGIDNIYKALYQRDNIFLIGDPVNVDMLKKFVKEHYAEDIEGVPVRYYKTRFINTSRRYKGIPVYKIIQVAK